MKKVFAAFLLAGLAASAALVANGVLPVSAQPAAQGGIADNELDPAVWGKQYPDQYNLWKQTELPSPTGKSKYKRGSISDRITYDKLSEYPYLALLFNGWGFGNEYNEPRGHAHMLRDQIEIDASRLKGGGVCLTCKTPYGPKFQREMGAGYFKMSFNEAIKKIPEKHRGLGVACVDCHNNKDMSLRISRVFTLTPALKDIGKNTDKMSDKEIRSVICAQCHVTYVIERDKDMGAVASFYPWQGSKWGNISVENIIKKIRSNPAYNEWKQSVTGYKLGYIRHPEFEMFTNNSIHWSAGVTCVDCHMPPVKVDGRSVTDHRVMSPLNNNMKACARCHKQSPEWLRDQVIAIQDRVVSLMLRSGYATATVAKLLEQTHKLQAEGKQIDKTLYEQAKNYYLEAFYRCNFINAENSVGFHNPTEALRILGDATAFATKAEALLRQALAQAGVNVPLKVDLELNKYLDNRGQKKLKFRPEQEFKDPTGVQVNF